MAGELCILDRTGDTRSIWDPNNPAEVEAAKATFDALRRKGYIAYRVERDASKGEIMTEFDPHAGKVILAPPVVGG